MDPTEKCKKQVQNVSKSIILQEKYKGHWKTRKRTNYYQNTCRFIPSARMALGRSRAPNIARNPKGFLAILGHPRGRRPPIGEAKTPKKGPRKPQNTYKNIILQEKRENGVPCLRRQIPLLQKVEKALVCARFWVDSQLFPSRANPYQSQSRLRQKHAFPPNGPESSQSVTFYALKR